MIAHDGGQSTSSAYLLNDFGQPSAAGLRVFDTPHLVCRLRDITGTTLTVVGELAKGDAAFCA
jgi:hypothetical protein